MFYLYIIKNQNNKLYVGITKDPKQRLCEHNSKRGAYFTHEGGFKIVFLEEYTSLSLARKREVQIKKWSRIKKEFLIDKFSKGLPTKVN